MGKGPKSEEQHRLMPSIGHAVSTGQVSFFNQSFAH